MTGAFGAVAGAFGAAYVKTPHAKVGDLGSQTLARRDTGVVWTAGSEVEQMHYYKLCASIIYIERKRYKYQ